MPMKGMEPPSPVKRQGLPYTACEAFIVASDSQGAKVGGTQPAPRFSALKVTVAPYGGSASRTRFMVAAARMGSTVGGRRIDSLRAVSGRSTLPATGSGGRPAAPVTDKAGLQVRRRASSPTSGLAPPVGRPPGTNGNRWYIGAPSSLAADRICSSWSLGISAWSSGSLISPVVSSSMRDRSVRIMRNEEGTIPLASPEWTPSVRIFTDSSPATMPRSDVVIHMFS
mmetsp:Transcript_18294/g.43009  ORF Transcript_18294/g.43009 Transcript_18294/m.43009 type:complete len:226 (+) Transcript_18294:211-888(+)